MGNPTIGQDVLTPSYFYPAIYLLIIAVVLVFSIKTCSISSETADMKETSIKSDCINNGGMPIYIQHSLTCVWSKHEKR